MPDVVVHQAMSETYRAEAAEVLWESFREKMMYVVGRRNSAQILARLINPALTMVAEDPESDSNAASDSGTLLAVASISDPSGTPLDFSQQKLAREFGPVMGRVRAIIGSFEQVQAGENELFLNSIAVTESARGRGVGSILMDAIHDRARASGLTSVRLRVVDNNLRAKALYERLGYRMARRVRIPLIKPITGHGGYYEMVLDLARHGDSAPEPALERP